MQLMIKKIYHLSLFVCFYYYSLQLAVLNGSRKDLWLLQCNDMLRVVMALASTQAGPTKKHDGMHAYCIGVN